MRKADMRDTMDVMITTQHGLIAAQNDMLERMKLLRAELHNRSPLKRAPAVSARISPQLAQSIRAMHARFPDRTMSQIAQAHNLNSEGRVSEVLRGKRK